MHLIVVVSIPNTIHSFNEYEFHFFVSHFKNVDFSDENVSHTKNKPSKKTN